MLENELSISDYVRILRRRWPVLGIAVLVAASLALLLSLIATPQYRSTVRILVDTDSANEIFDPVTGQARGARAMTNESEFARSGQVKNEAVARLREQGFDEVANVATVTTSESSDSDVLVLRAVALSGSDAALAAETYASSYIELRSDNVVQEYLDTLGVIEVEFAKVQDELDALPDEGGARKAILESQLSSLGQAMSDLRVSAELGGSGAQVLGDASVPASPFTPRTTRNLVLGLVLGLIGGIGVVVFLDAIDTSISSKEQIEAITDGVTTLAIVPAIRDWRERSTTRIVTIERPQAQESEAYRTLRAALDFATIDSDARMIQVTSANAGEGKTTTAVNLAVTLARSGKRVMIVDADLRKPRLHAFFDVPIEPGLTTLILGQVSPEKAGHEVERQAGALRVVTSGPLPPGPSEVLGSTRAHVVLDQLLGLCDVVILDSPPVLPVADSLVLAKKADATILVVNGARTRAPELSQAVELLRQVDANLVGTVLNQVKRRSGGYGYGYGYGQDETGEGSVSNRRVGRRG